MNKHKAVMRTGRQEGHESGTNDTLGISRTNDTFGTWERNEKNRDCLPFATIPGDGWFKGIVSGF